MQFVLAEINSAYPILRATSESDIYQVGIYPTIDGVRITGSKSGSMFYLKEGYCCGTAPALVHAVFLTFLSLFSSFQEQDAEDWIEEQLPPWHRRPINRDDTFIRLIACANQRKPQDYEVDPVIHQALLIVCKNLEHFQGQSTRHTQEAIALRKQVRLPAGV